MGVQIDQAPGTLQALVRGLKLHITLLVPPCPKINGYFGIDMTIKHQLHFFRTERKVEASRGHDFVPSRGFPQACIRHWYDYQTSTTFSDRANDEGFTSAWLCPVERLPQACMRTALSRPFRHRFGPVQGPPTICAGEPVACLSCKLAVMCWRSIGPSTMVVFKLRTSLWVHPLCPQVQWKIWYSCSRPYELYIFDDSK